MSNYSLSLRQLSTSAKKHIIEAQWLCMAFYPFNPPYRQILCHFCGSARSYCILWLSCIKMNNISGQNEALPLVPSTALQHFCGVCELLSILRSGFPNSKTGTLSMGWQNMESVRKHRFHVCKKTRLDGFTATACQQICMTGICFKPVIFHDWCRQTRLPKNQSSIFILSSLLKMPLYCL